MFLLLSLFFLLGRRRWRLSAVDFAAAASPPNRAGAGVAAFWRAGGRASSSPAEEARVRAPQTAPRPPHARMARPRPRGQRGHSRRTSAASVALTKTSCSAAWLGAAGAASERSRRVLFGSLALHGSIWTDFWTTKERPKNQRFFDPLQIDPRRSKNRPFGTQGPHFHGF